MKTAVKAILLTLHTAVSLLVAFFVASAFVAVPVKDGSSTTPGSLIAGMLALVACCLPAVPLLVGAATKWISHWWVVAHAVLTLAAIVLIVYAVNCEPVAPTGP